MAQKDNLQGKDASVVNGACGQTHGGAAFVQYTLESTHESRVRAGSCVVISVVFAGNNM